MGRSRGPALIPQSPEQGGGCRCLPKFLEIDGFPRSQLIAPWPRLPQSSLKLVVVLHLSQLRSSLLDHPRGCGAAQRLIDLATHPKPMQQDRQLPRHRYCRSSSRSFPRVRTAAARTVVSRCRVQTVPRYTARSPPVSLPVFTGCNGLPFHYHQQPATTAICFARLYMRKFRFSRTVLCTFVLVMSCAAQEHLSQHTLDYGDLVCA
jgi:hypothetical protein